MRAFHQASLLLAMLALGVLLGWSLGGIWQGTVDQRDASLPAMAEEPEIEYWVAPMDPNFRRDGPGKSPMGMDLVPVYRNQGGADAADSIRIPAAIQHNLGLTSALVTRGELRQELTVPAVVAPDNDRLSHVHVKTAGWVRNLKVTELGQPVSAGEPLLRLYSPALLDAQREYLSARRRGVPGLMQAAASKLRLLGMGDTDLAQLGTADEPLQTVAVNAPRDGVVTAVNTAEGMYTTPGDVVMSISDLTVVWLLLDVPASRAAMVRLEQEVRLQGPGLGGRQWRGRIERLYPTVDLDNRSLRARVSLPNPNGSLVPGQYLQAIIDIRDTERRLLVPADALIRDGLMSRVVLHLGDGRFRAQEVVAGMESDGQVEILHGLSEGDRVVTAAQFLVDSEASLRGALTRLQAAPEGDAEQDRSHD